MLQNEDYGRETLHPFLVDVVLDECHLMWHIATDLCFYDQEDEPLSKDYHNLAKLISDYMINLLVMRSDMMTEVVGVESGFLWHRKKGSNCGSEGMPKYSCCQHQGRTSHSKGR